MLGQQLSKRNFTNPSKHQSSTGTFLRLKGEAVQLLSQLDLYRENIANYHLFIAQINSQMEGCDRYEQGQLCLLLCQTALNMDLPLCSLPLRPHYPDLIIQYVNHLLECGDTAQLKQQTTREVYQGKFKAATPRRTYGDQSQRFRNLLLIERIDVVLAQVVREFGQAQINARFSKATQEAILGILVLAQKYLGNAQFLDFKNNVQLIMQSNTRFKSLKRNTSGSFRPNYVIIDQTTADFPEPDMVVSRRDHLQPRSVHRSSTRLQPTKTNSIYGSINSSNDVFEEKTISGSIRMKGSFKRGSGTHSVTKRGSIEDKKSSEFIVRKSTHFMSKYETKLGVPPQRKSRFQMQMLTKNEISALKDEFPSHKSSISMKEDQSVHIRRRQTSHFTSLAQNEGPKIRPFYIFLQEKQKIHLLVFQQATYCNFDQPHNQKQTQLTLLFDNFAVVSSSKLTKQLQIGLQYEEQGYVQELVRILQAFRNMRNQLTFSINRKFIEDKQNCNIVNVTERQNGLLMGFIRKASTHFIALCVFDLSQLQNCCLRGIKRRLLNENKTISFEMTFNYKLMNQDLYMTFEQDPNFVKRKGSLIASGQKPDSSEQVTYLDEENYKIINSILSFKQSSEARFSNVWWNHNYDLVCYMFKNKRREKRSGTEIIKRQKIGSSNYDPKRMKRMAQNKSSIKLHENQLQRIIENSQYIKFPSNLKTPSRREVQTNEHISSHQRIIKLEKVKKRQLNRGKELIDSIRTQKGYKLVRRWVLQQPQEVKYSEYYGYLQRKANLIEYHKQKSSFLSYNQSNYLRTSLTIHGKRNKVEPRNTKLLTFLKRLKSESALLGYLVGSIKLLSRQKNKHVFMEVYWQSMQKYFVFVLSQDLFQKITQIQLDHFEKHSFSTANEKQQPKKREKRTSVVSSLLRSRDKDNYGSLKKSDQSNVQTLKVPKMLSIERQQLGKLQSAQKIKPRTNTMFKVDKTDGFSFSTFSNMKESERLHFKREVAAYIKNKFIKNAEFFWRQHTLVLEIFNPNRSGEKMVEIEGKELAVKNVHLSKTAQISDRGKQQKEWRVSATELLVIRYKQSNLANLKFYTSQGLNKIYLEHLFLKNNDDLFGCYRNKLCLREINDNKARIAQFYSKENGFFEPANRELDNFFPISQPYLKHFFSKNSNKEEQKRYKYAEIINFAKKCSLSFDFVQNKRKRLLKDMFVIPNRYPHLQFEDFMLAVQITFEDILIKDLNGQVLLAFSKEKMLTFFPYIFRMNKTQLKTLIIKRLLRDEDLIRLCELRQSELNTF